MDRTAEKRGGCMQKMPMVWVLCFFCFLAGAAPQTETANPDLIRKAGPGRINWSKGLIEAMGEAVPPESYQGNQEGRSMAIRDALEIARKNL